MCCYCFFSQSELLRRRSRTSEAHEDEALLCECSPVLAFVLKFSLYIAGAAEISQPVPFQTVKLGNPATIECHVKSSLNKRVWYKFTTGMGLQLVVAFDNFYNRSIFPEESQRRYSVKFDKINSHLHISATTWEDVGTYFCGVKDLNEIQFGSGTFLTLEGANPIRDSTVQQRESGPVQPGDSVTLSCSVHTGRFAAEHMSVTWLKISHPSAPQIYYSGNKSCERTESGETSCVYELLLRNLSSDDAGTFYCVLTSCGHTLFGNGTRIIVHKSADTKLSEPSPTVIALMLSNIILGIVTLILIWKLCKTQRKDSTEATDGSSEGNQTTDTVTYAPVCLAPRRFPTRQARGEYCEDSVVYSNLRYCQQNRQRSLLCEEWRMYRVQIIPHSISSTMTPPNFALYFTCLFVANLAHMTTLKQSSLRFQSAKVGERVTLTCVCDRDIAISMFYWYKQTLGQKPKLMSSFYRHSGYGTFQDEFNNHSRFSQGKINDTFFLKILDLQISDSASYYCVGSNLYDFEFYEGTTVSVEGSGWKVPATVHQSASESIQPGGSVTLNCTVHTETCDGEHSVYWFKKSEESQPGLIYTHGDRTDQCERKPNTQTHTCVYNLPMKSLNLSHAGTYYCAVASCGHILFGNGTKLDLEDKGDSPVWIYFLSAALAFTTFLSVLLAFLVYQVNKRSCQECNVTFSATSTPNIALSGEAQLSDISQPAAFQAVELGHTVTFTCNIKSAARTRVWYTLNTGRRLQPLASTDTLYNLTIIKDKSHRYEVQSDHISSLLTILRTTWEDVGTYYCGVMDLRDIQFGQGTF
ncbi:hypothetical protein FQN60_006093 [Etheostoma spectabile]|uniref:Ig-like domain-containing protein n=2 Tax=Etheostoma spectabile TaxID=54343 RepID=A0A5J5CKK5_9PERO|nr:hypothetical protein FQN60_006093 [Etheostoma spectabile]